MTDDRFAALERRIRDLEARVKSLTTLRRGDCAEIQKAKTMATNAAIFSARKQSERKS
jgi:hypothetical protein